MDQQICPICGLAHFARTISECPSVASTHDYDDSKGAWTLVTFRAGLGLEAKKFNRRIGHESSSLNRRT